MLVQKDLGEKRAHWVTSLQEYDIEIKLAKIVYGQGLWKKMTQAIDSNSHDVSDEQEVQEIQQVNSNSYSWYVYLIYYLTHGTAPLHLDTKKKCALRLKYNQY